MITRETRDKVVGCAAILAAWLALSAFVFTPPPSFVSGSAAKPCTGVTNNVWWVDGNTGISKTGSNVTAWSDSSPSALGLTSSSNPQFVTSAPNSNGAVSFVAGSSNRMDTAASFTQAQPYSIYGMVNVPTLVSAARIFRNAQTEDSPSLILRAGPTLVAGSLAGDAQNFSFTANTWFMVRAVFNGTSTLLERNNTGDVTTAVNATGAWSSQGINIGGTTANADFGTVIWAKICIWNKAIAHGSSDDTFIKSMFTAQYGIP